MATVTKAANAHTTVAVGWTNPSNAYATTGDDTYATTALGTGKTVTNSGRFGFPAFSTSDIPAGATINSVTVEVEWAYTVQVTGATLGLQLHNPAGTALGSETTKTTATEAAGTQQVTSGITLTDLRSANLVVAHIRFSKGNTATDSTGRLDYVRLTVDYTPIADARSTVSFFEFEIPAAPAATELTPASVTHTRGQGSAKVNPSLVAASLTHTRGQGAPTVSSATNLSPASVTHTRGQGAAAVNPSLVPASLVHTRGIGAASLLLLQFIRPASDTAAGGWTPEPSSPATLYDKVSDDSSSSYITATAS